MKTALYKGTNEKDTQSILNHVLSTAGQFITMMIQSYGIVVQWISITLYSARSKLCSSAPSNTKSPFCSIQYIPDPHLLHAASPCRPMIATQWTLIYRAGDMWESKSTKGTKSNYLLLGGVSVKDLELTQPGNRRGTLNPAAWKHEVILQQWAPCVRATTSVLSIYLSWLMSIKREGESWLRLE